MFIIMVCPLSVLKLPSRSLSGFQQEDRCADPVLKSPATQEHCRFRCAVRSSASLVKQKEVAAQSTKSKDWEFTNEMLLVGDLYIFFGNNIDFKV